MRRFDGPGLQRRRRAADKVQVEVTLSFPSHQAIRLYTGDPRAHRVLLLALAANGLDALASRISVGAARAVAVADDEREPLGRAIASWLAEL
jgi:hypothetical protein